MPGISYRVSRATDVGKVAARMREIDVLECRETGHTPKQALRSGLLLSDVPVTVELDGEPIAMFGIVPTSLTSGEGAIWFLGTEDVYTQGRAWLAEAKPWIERQPFRVLRNRVHASNTRAIRLLRWLGFDIAPTNPCTGFRDFICVTR